MRKFLAILPCVILAACASTPKDISRFAPFGVASVVSNGEITWYGEQPEKKGLLNMAMDKALSKKDDAQLSKLLSRADTLVDVGDQSLRTILANSGSNRLVEKETLVATKAYGSAKESKMLKASGLILPSNYKFVDSQDKELASELCAETGTGALIYANFAFNKTMVTGVEKNGSMTAAVTLTAIVVDATGKRILSKSYYARGTSNIPIVAGVYDPRALADLFQPAISKVCADFAKDMSN